MSITEALIAFALTAGLVTLTPGLDTALVLRTAAVERGGRAFMAGLGISVGCLTWGVAAALGLGALLAASEWAYTLLRWAGAGYLVYLGGQLLWRARSAGGSWPKDRPAEWPASTGGGWFMRGLLTNLLNPKIGVFYVTFLPQFVPAGAEVLSFTVLLAFIHALESLLWFIALILATQPLGRLLRQPRVVRALDGLTGGVLVGFGLNLAWQARRMPAG